MTITRFQRSMGTNPFSFFSSPIENSLSTQSGLKRSESPGNVPLLAKDPSKHILLSMKLEQTFVTGKKISFFYSHHEGDI